MQARLCHGTHLIQSKNIFTQLCSVDVLDQKKQKRKR